ncbi:MAG: hypothetical protein IJH63_00730 [Methanobrevibacter sp.]|nr:hypothetical protein [Methanosphaera sp.]MBR0369229.1 hypothetical protein [Methanobrevibacter sp.]
MKHVYKDKRSGNYFICKRINGKMKYFGYYPNKIEAEKALSRLIDSDWKILPSNNIRPRYYTYNKKLGAYVVKRKVKGRDKIFKYCQTEQEAQKTVKLLEETNWNNHPVSSKKKIEEKESKMNKDDKINIKEETRESDNIMEKELKETYKKQLNNYTENITARNLTTNESKKILTNALKGLNTITTIKHNPQEDKIIDQNTSNIKHIINKLIENTGIIEEITITLKPTQTQDLLKTLTETNTTNLNYTIIKKQDQTTITLKNNN